MNQGDQKSKFEDYSQESRISFFAEFWYFLKYNKKWWLLPIIVILMLLGLIVILGGTSIGPFIYPLL